MNVMQRALDRSADMPNARDLGDGRKQIDVNQSLRPIKIPERHLPRHRRPRRLGHAGGEHRVGRVPRRAGHAVGRLAGAVSGTLNLPVNVPGALVKSVQVQVGADGFTGTANISPSDPSAATSRCRRPNSVVTVRSSPAGGVEVSIAGGATVTVANGMASGSAQMTATINAGPGGVTFTATIVGNLQIAGLQANAQATIDLGRHNSPSPPAPTSRSACPASKASRTFATPRAGSASSARTSSSPSRSCRRSCSTTSVEDGRLKATLSLGSAVSMPLPGGGTASLTASTVRLTAPTSPARPRRFSVGPGGAAALAGT